MTQSTKFLAFSINNPEGPEVLWKKRIPTNPQSKLVFSLFPKALSVNHSPSKSSKSIKASKIQLTEAKNLIPLSIQAFKTFLQVLQSKEISFPYISMGTTEDMVGNVSFFIRTLMQEGIPAEAMGITTGENLLQGLLAAYNAYLRRAKAQGIDDKAGVIESSIDVTRGAVQAIGGAFFTGYRGVMIAAETKKNIDTSSLHAPTALGRSAFALGTGANAFFGLLYLAIGAWATYGFTKDWQFSLALKAHENDPSSLFDFLLHKVKADPKAKLQKLNAYWQTLSSEEKKKQMSQFKGKLKEAALDYFTQRYLTLQNKQQKTHRLTSKPLTEAETKALFAFIFDSTNQGMEKIAEAYMSILGIQASDLQDLSLSPLEWMGFAIEENKRGQRHEAKFSRVTNLECAKAVQKAAEQGLKSRLTADDPVVQQSAEAFLSELKGKVVCENQISKCIHAALMVIAVLGISVVLLGAFVFPPTGIILTIITLILITAMACTDGYSLWKAWKGDGIPGRYDKAYLIAVSVVLFAALAVSIGMTLGLGLPLLPMILAIVIGAIGFGTTGTAYFKAIEKEKKWKENHPNLQAFKALLDAHSDVNSIVDDKVITLFKKLPKEVREEIKERYGALSRTGALDFRQEFYRKLDETHDFGGRYLSQFTLNDRSQLTPQDYQFLGRAVKKSVKFFWEKTQEKESEVAHALLMQGLLDRILSGTVTKEEIVRHLAKLDFEASSRLKGDLWYVVKRQESLNDLKNTVNTLLSSADK